VRPVLIAAVVLAGCAVGSALRPAHSQPPERLPELKAGSDVAPGAPDLHTPYGVGKAPFSHRPATSCAASSCHGGGAVGKVGSEHSTWAPEAFPKGKQDPHAKAYRVLFNPVSTEMAKKLGLPNAHTAAVCLKCHAVETGGDPETRDQVLSEGVGCSGCHGPADKWISEHYLPSWKALSNREKWEKYGFVPTNNLVARTLNCAGCHVGDAERDLNHDLYAAGHPRITFEAGRMHHQPDYRTHWTEKLPPLDFEVRVWVIGQAATLRAAVELLHQRSKRAADGDPKTPWPELSLYSCYACHQKLPDVDIRSVVSTSTTKRKAGVPGWEVWSNAAVGVAADSCGLAFPGLSSPNLTGVKLPKLDQLRETMGKSIAPPAKTVRDESAAALKELDTWLSAMQAAEDRVKEPVAKGTPRLIANKLARNALAADGKLADHDWDALAQNYLGAAAMYHAAGGSAGSEWGPELKGIADNLLFPKFTNDVFFNSPADLQRAKLFAVRDKFEILRTKTGTSEGK